MQREALLGRRPYTWLLTTFGARRTTESVQSQMNPLPRFQLVTELMNQARVFYPVRWYHNRATGTLLACAVGAGLNLARTFLAIELSRLMIVGGVGLLALGVFLDIYSTLRVTRLKPEFDQRELAFPVIETNPLLPVVPSWRDLLFTRYMLIWAAVVALTIWFPELGVSVVILKLPICWGNLRLADILKRSLTVYDQGNLRRVI